MNGPPAMRPPLRAYAALVVMTIAFGGTFVATKVALCGFEPLLIAFVRFVVAGAILWLVWRWRGEREAVTRRELGRLAALGFVSLTVYFTFENVGIAHKSASDAASTSRSPPSDVPSTPRAPSSTSATTPANDSATPSH